MRLGSLNLTRVSCGIVRNKSGFAQGLTPLDWRTTVSVDAVDDGAMYGEMKLELYSMCLQLDVQVLMEQQGTEGSQLDTT